MNKIDTNSSVIGHLAVRPEVVSLCVDDWSSGYKRRDEVDKISAALRCIQNAIVHRGRFWTLTWSGAGVFKRQTAARTPKHTDRVVKKLKTLCFVCTREMQEHIVKNCKINKFKQKH